jgi:hypothetical protein
MSFMLSGMFRQSKGNADGDEKVSQPGTGVKIDGSMGATFVGGVTCSAWRMAVETPFD